MEVVGDQSITGALGEKGDHCDEHQALPVSGSFHKVRPAGLSIDLLKAKRLLDLVELREDKPIVDITRGMILGSALVDAYARMHGIWTNLHQDCKSFVRTIL